MPSLRSPHERRHIVIVVQIHISSVGKQLPHTCVMPMAAGQCEGGLPRHRVLSVDVYPLSNQALHLQIRLVFVKGGQCSTRGMCTPSKSKQRTWFR